MATIDIVKEVLSENLDIEADKVVDEATFEELGVDSLEHGRVGVRPGREVRS